MDPSDILYVSEKVVFVYDFNIFRVAKTQLIKLKLKLARMLGRKKCKFYFWSLKTLEQNWVWLEKNGYTSQILLKDNGWDAYLYWEISIP